MRNGGDSMIKTAFYDTKEYDKPSFEKYGQTHDIKFRFLETKLNEDTVAEDRRKLNYLNFPEFISDLSKWGFEIAPFFDSEEYFSEASVYFLNEAARGSLSKDCLWPLVKMPDNMAMDPEKYFKECVISAAVALDKDHNPNNPDLYTTLGKTVF